MEFHGGYRGPGPGRSPDIHRPDRGLQDRSLVLGREKPPLGEGLGQESGRLVNGARGNGLASRPHRPQKLDLPVNLPDPSLRFIQRPQAPLERCQDPPAFSLELLTLCRGQPRIQTGQVREIVLRNGGFE